VEWAAEIPSPRHINALLKLIPWRPLAASWVVNRSLDLETAVMINRIFTEIIIAPAYDEGVFDVLTKKKNRRLITYDPETLVKPSNPYEIKTMLWGYLAQEWDNVNEDINDWRVMTNRSPSKQEFDAMLFGWRTVSLLNSNAIALCYPQQAIGLGIGQTSRIDSVSISIWKARKFKHDLNLAVCASDGFFPYRDSIGRAVSGGRESRDPTRWFQRR